MTKQEPSSSEDSDSSDNSDSACSGPPKYPTICSPRFIYSLQMRARCRRPLDPPDTIYETGSNTSDYMTPPPKAKDMPVEAESTREAGPEIGDGATESSEVVTQTTSGTPDRPGRKRKPTQKAAELAANSSSKLFKSTRSRQVNNNHVRKAKEDTHTGTRDISIDATENDAVKSNLTPKETARKGAKQRAATKPSTDDITLLAPATARIRNETETPSPEASVARGKRKPIEEADKQERSPTKKTKITTRRNTRAKTKVPAPSIEVVSPIRTPASESIEPVIRPSTDDKDIAAANPQPTSPPRPEKPSPPLTRSAVTKDSETDTITRSDPPNGCFPTNTEESSTSTTTSSSSTQSTTATSKPPRLKLTFNPPPPRNTAPTATPNQLCTTTPDPAPAQTAATTLPCSLTCLDDADLFYIWATVAIEHEDLADQICEWSGPNGFGGNASEEAKKVREKLHGVLREFCRCKSNERHEEGEGKAGKGLKRGGKRTRGR